MNNLQIVTKLWMLLSVLCNVSQMYCLWKHLAHGFPVRAPPGCIMRREGHICVNDVFSIKITQ